MRDPIVQGGKDGTPPLPGVLMVAAGFYPEIAGGGHLQCDTLIRALQNRVRFQVLSVTRPSDLPDADMVEGVPLFRIKLDTASLKDLLGAAWRVIRFFMGHRRQFSVVHCHGFTQKMLLVIGLARLFGKRVIVKMTLYGFDDPVTLRQGLLGPLRLVALKGVDRFVGVSPVFAESFQRSGLPLERLVGIPNGVDTVRFSPPASLEARFALRRTLGLPVDRPVITFVGHFSRRKGVAELVRAWLDLRERGHRSHLVLIGSMSPETYEVDPELVETVRATVKDAGAEQDVEFVGRTPEVATYLRAFELSVLPSYRERLPNALLEAMACGLACVVPRLPGITGRVMARSQWTAHQPWRCGGLAGGVEELLSGPELRRGLGARARKTSSPSTASSRWPPATLAIPEPQRRRRS